MKVTTDLTNLYKPVVFFYAINVIYSPFKMIFFPYFYLCLCFINVY